MIDAASRHRSAADATLADLFAQRRSDGAADLRARAWEAFSREGLPNRRVESWRYTDLRAALLDVKPPRPRGGSYVELADDRLRIALTASEFAAHPAALAAAPDGVTISSLREELAMRNPRVLAALAPACDDPVVALNAALMQDGAVAQIAPGAKIDRPIEICVLPLSEESSFTRSLVLLGAGAQATIVESYGVGALGAQGNHALVFDIGAGAKLDHVMNAASASADSVRVISLLTTLGAGASLNSFCLIRGGGLLRRQIFARLEGEGNEAVFSGATLLRGDDHADTSLTIEHAAPGGKSRERFRTIVDGRATGVFQGKVVVRPGARKTDGAMQSKALLLSPSATMNNKPELEIYADDVACGHGATTGRLDSDLLFYLESRGIPPMEAEALLIEGFAGEAFESVADEALRDELSRGVSAWLALRTLER